MFSTTSLLVFVTLALSISATTDTPAAIYSLPLRRIQNITSGHNLVQSGLNRAQNFRNAIATREIGHVKRQTDSKPVINEAVEYIATVGVGASASTYDLIVDSGSSNTWVGATKKFTPTSTSTDTGHSVSVTYGSGSFSGTEWIDEVTLTSSLVIKSQSIGVASTSEGFEGVDGILGLGPDDGTEDTVSGVGIVPTVTDNLLAQGTISQAVVGVSFEPTTTEEVTNGSLDFGGVDSSKIIGNVTFTPATSAIANHWGITQSVSYNGVTIATNQQGIVDTGTTLLYMATSTFNSYIKATGGVLDDNTGLYKITAAQLAALKPLVFTIGGTDFPLPANGQIWPRSLNADIGGTANGIYLVAGDAGSLSNATGLIDFEFINGYVFLERFYSVFDTTNNRVGFATTPFTNATTN